jgi:hypothetical protein
VSGELTDAYGDGCSWYADNQEECGTYDSGEFLAKQECCECGGGFFEEEAQPEPEPYNQFDFKPDDYIWSGNWEIIGRYDDVPNDYYVATLDFVMEHQQNIVDQLDTWGIAAFYGGKIDGRGYGGGYHEISEDPWIEVNGGGLSGVVIIAEALPFTPTDDPVGFACMCRSTSGYSAWYCEESSYFNSFNYNECESSFCYWGKADGSTCAAP